MTTNVTAIAVRGETVPPRTNRDDHDNTPGLADRIRFLLPDLSASDVDALLERVADYVDVVCEALQDWRWLDRKIPQRYGFDLTTAGHPLSGRCARDGRPVAECGGPVTTREGWIYGSPRCAAPILLRWRDPNGPPEIVDDPAAGDDAVQDLDRRSSRDRGRR